MSRKLVYLFLFVSCMKLVVCALAERTVSQIGNPMIDLDLCGRKGIRSNVCDPDGLVTVEQAFKIDELIKTVYNDTTCPCSSALCKAESRMGGVVVGVALIQGMNLSINIQSIKYESNSEDRYRLAVLNEGRVYAGTLLAEWKMGICHEDLLIFYARDNNVLYVASNKKVPLSDHFISSVLRQSVFHLVPPLDKNLADTLKSIISHFKVRLLKSRAADQKSRYSEEDNTIHSLDHYHNY